MSNEFYTYDNFGKLVGTKYAYWYTKVGKITRITDAIMTNNTNWFSDIKPIKITLYCWSYKAAKRKRVLYFKIKD